MMGDLEPSRFAVFTQKMQTQQARHPFERLFEACPLLQNQQAVGNLHLLRPDEWTQAAPLYRDAPADRRRAYCSAEFLPTRAGV